MKITISNKKLFEALSNAISDNAIGYWGYTKASYEDVFNLIKRGKSIDVFDIDDDEKLATMTKESIENGVEVFVNEYTDSFANIMDETEDVLDTDILFQLCCFGELVYG